MKKLLLSLALLVGLNDFAIAGSTYSCLLIASSSTEEQVLTQNVETSLQELNVSLGDYHFQTTPNAQTGFVFVVIGHLPINTEGDFSSGLSVKTSLKSKDIDVDFKHTTGDYARVMCSRF